MIRVGRDFLRDASVRAVFAFCVVASSPIAYAQSAMPELAPDVAADEAARLLFSAGATAYSEGRYADAVVCFERAHVLSGRPEMLYNLALALDRLRQDERALAAYRAFLERADADSPHREEVTRRVEAIERAIAEKEALEARVARALEEDARRRPIRRRRLMWSAIGVAVAAAIVVPVVIVRRGEGLSTPSDFGQPVNVRIGAGR